MMFNMMMEEGRRRESGPMEENWSDLPVDFLLRSNTTNGSTAFTDSSHWNASLLRDTTMYNGTFANPFGASTCIYSTGANYPTPNRGGIYATSNLTRYRIGSGGAAFNVCFWIYFTSCPAVVDRVFHFGGSGSTWSASSGMEWIIQFSNNGTLRYGGISYNIGGTNGYKGIGYILELNTWYFIEFCNDPVNNKFHIFVNGVDQCTAPNSSITISPVTSLYRFVVSGSQSQYNPIYGYGNDFKIQKAVGHTRTYTRPTALYSGA